MKLTVVYNWNDDNDTSTLAIYVDNAKTNHKSFGYSPLGIFQCLEQITKELGVISEISVYEISEDDSGEYFDWLYKNHGGNHPKLFSDIPDKFLQIPPRYRDASILKG